MRYRTGNSLLDLILPRTCTVCGRRLLSFERHICTGCLADLPLTFNWMMPHNTMADRFNERIQESVCGILEDGDPPGEHIPYSFASSLFFFNSEALYRHIPYSVKYHMDIQLGVFFGKVLGKMLSLSPVMKDIDMIIPVPLHWSRKWKRGYNQAEVIARGISMSLGAPVETGILYRRHRTRTQTRLSVSEKAENVKGAFEVRGNIPENVRHILIVDDVFTTGATLHACWEAIHDTSPHVRISIATLAMVNN